MALDREVYADAQADKVQQHISANVAAGACRQTWTPQYVTDTNRLQTRSQIAMLE